MLNHITLQGRLTKCPELKHTASGTPVLSFCIACQREMKNQKGEYDTDFINWKAFGKTADFIEKYFNKGQLILLQGSLNMNKYVDSEGNNKIFPEVLVNKVYFRESKSQQVDFTEIENGGDLPF